MSEKQEKILYMCTCGADRSEMAHVPFVLGNAALAMDIEATIVMQGEGVMLAKKGYVDTMPPGGGFPPIKDLLASFVELGGKILVCGPCIKTRDIAESDLIDGAEITAAGSVNLAAIEADAVFVFYRRSTQRCCEQTQSAQSMPVHKKTGTGQKEAPHGTSHDPFPSGTHHRSRRPEARRC